MAVPNNIEARLERWEKRLGSITTQSLTTDYVRPSEDTRIVEAVHSVTLPESATTALLQLSILDGSNSVSPFTILLSAFAILAARLTGDEDISIGSEGENKEPFVLRLPIDLKNSFATLLSTVKGVCRLHYGPRTATDWG
jgi:L-aminoadipate-semialdehyde dehydrogenase